MAGADTSPEARAARLRAIFRRQALILAIGGPAFAVISFAFGFDHDAKVAALIVAGLSLIGALDALWLGEYMAGAAMGRQRTTPARALALAASVGFTVIYCGAVIYFGYALWS